MSIQQAWFKNALHTEKLNIFEDNQAGFVFSTPTGTISSKQIFKNIDFSQDADLAFQPQLQQWLQQSKNLLEYEINSSKNNELILVGGIPFDAQDLPELSVVEANNTHLLEIFSDRHLGLNDQPVTAKLIPESKTYKAGVDKLVQLMQDATLKKAVLARAIDITTHKKINVADLFYRLLASNTEGYTFAFAQQPKKQGWFMGASPELLVAKHNQHVFSHPVAGTLPRHSDPTEDQLRATQLLASAKDQQEHAVVIEAIADQLAPFCKNLQIPKQPSLIKTSTLWHLATQIQGVLKDTDTHVFDLVAALHPTPAVCGQPPQLARELIANLEPFNRSLFAGAVGWSDVRGNGAWSVSVRCGRVFEQMVRLYAGAGIVAASKAELELNETAAKFQTMLNALGLKAEELVY